MPADPFPSGDGAHPQPIIGALTGTSAATLTAKGELTPLSLEREAEQAGLSVADQIALGDHELRKWMARWIVYTFIGSNVVTLIVIGALFALDQINIAHNLIAPGDRIITDKVIMALLGATTVQVGVIAGIIARYLFPSRTN